MAESRPDPQPEAPEHPGKPVLNGAAVALSLIEGSDPDPDQYGWGV